MNKLLKKHIDLIIIVSILLLVSVLLFIFSFTLAYFNNKKEISGQISLGELDYTITVQNLSQNNVLPGDEIETKVNLENKVTGKTNLIPFYFRFKVLNDENNLSNIVQVDIDENFIYDGNFNYYKHKLQFGEKVNLFNKIKISKSLTKENAEDLNIFVLVEAVQSEYDAYKEIFYDAPLEWVQFIENN